MYTLTRTSTVPASPMKIMIDRQEAGDPDAGFGMGGTYYFEPGDRHAVSDEAARAVMTDPGLKVHFRCDPPFADGGNGSQ